MYLNLFRNTKHSPVCSRRDLSGLLYPEYYILFIFIRRRYQGFFRQIFLKTDPTIPQKPRSPEYQKRETFFLFYMVFSVFKRQSEDFFMAVNRSSYKPCPPGLHSGKRSPYRGFFQRGFLNSLKETDIRRTHTGSLRQNLRHLYQDDFQLHYEFAFNEMKNLQIKHFYLLNR